MIAVRSNLPPLSRTLLPLVCVTPFHSTRSTPQCRPLPISADYTHSLSVGSPSVRKTLPISRSEAIIPSDGLLPPITRPLLARPRHPSALCHPSLPPRYIYENLCISLYIYVYLCISMNILLYLRIYPNIYIYLSVPIDIYLYRYLYLYIHLYLYINNYLYQYLFI